MSVRTIVELNHDYTHRIEQDPEAFVALLVRYLSSAGPDNAEPLERFGVRVAWWGHHSDERHVVTKYAKTTL